MREFDYGPVEIFLIGFTGSRPGPELVDAMAELVEAGTARLLDLVFVSRDDAGEVTVLEIEDLEEQLGFPGLDFTEIGLVGEYDIDELAADVAPGRSAALLVVEHTWAKKFATALYAAGGEVIQSERITAPVINEFIAALDTP